VYQLKNTLISSTSAPPAEIQTYQLKNTLISSTSAPPAEIQTAVETLLKSKAMPADWPE
jgi:hypothetical protein